MKELTPEALNKHIKDLFFSDNQETFSLTNQQYATITGILTNYQRYQSGKSFYDTFLQLPTGGGKTICYKYPATQFDGVTLVISPLNRLMYNQVEEFNHSMETAPEPYRNYRAIVLRSDDNASLRKKKKDSLSNKNVKLIYITPEKASSPSVIQYLNRFSEISMIVCDEAHCISLWGLDFRPSYFRIPVLLQSIARSRQRPLIAAFTATATASVRKDIIQNLGLKLIPTDITPVTLRKENVTLELREVKQGEKNSAILTYLKEHLSEYDSQSKCIIFCSTISTTKALHRALLNDPSLSSRERIAICHSKLDNSIIAAQIEQFTRSNDDPGSARIMVATNIIGMGMNFPNIHLILHSNIPISIEDYYQQIGRADREGTSAARSILFYSKAEILYLKHKKENTDITPASIDRNPEQNIIALYQSRIKELRTRQMIQLVECGESIRRSYKESESDNARTEEELTDIRYYKASETDDAQTEEELTDIITQAIYNRIEEYFSNDVTAGDFTDLYAKLRNNYPKEIKQKERNIHYICMNTCKIAGLIRKGQYANHELQEIPVTDFAGADIIICTEADYFQPKLNRGVYALQEFDSWITPSIDTVQSFFHDCKKTILKCWNLNQMDYLYYKLKELNSISIEDLQGILLYTDGSHIKYQPSEDDPDLNVMNLPPSDVEEIIEAYRKHPEYRILVKCSDMIQLYQVYKDLLPCVPNYNIHISLRIRRYGSVKYVIHQEYEEAINDFDLMVLDAIYTLGEFQKGSSCITINDILRCISGDPNYRIYRRTEGTDSSNPNTSAEKNVWQHVISSIEKLQKTSIEITQTNNSLAHGYSHKTGWAGPMLKLKEIPTKKGIPKYRYIEKPILYEYSEDCHGQFFTIPHDMLRVRKTGNSGSLLPNSFLNLRLKYYMIYRVLLANPYYGRNYSEYMGKQRGMLLKIDCSDCKSNREIDNLNEKAAMILEHCRQYYKEQADAKHIRYIFHYKPLHRKEQNMEYQLIFQRLP